MYVDVDYLEDNDDAMAEAIAEDDDDDTVDTVTIEHFGDRLFRGYYDSDGDLQRYAGSFLCDSMSTLL